MGQEIQGVSTPLITVQTPYEKVRVIRISKAQYNMLRSFVESSLKDEYEWRTGYEFPGEWVWRKPSKWELIAYKKVTPVEAKELPVRGIYKVVSKIEPVAVLRSLRTSAEIWFVLIKPNMIGELGVFYDDTVKLVFTRRAPVMFVPAEPVPFSHPITVYEVFETLDYYVSF